MSLKYKIDSLEGLDESVASLYEQSGEKFILKVEGIDNPDDVAGLKQKVETLMAEKKKAKKDADEAAEAARLAAEEAARRGGDVEALEKSWQDKLTKAQQKAEDEAKSLRSIIDRKTVQATASELASSLAVEGSAKTLLPHIQSRLKTEFRDGEAVTVVLDINGKPSAMSVEELGQEIASDPAFAPIIVASKASGGGAKGSKGGGAAKKTITRKEYDAMEPEDRQKLIVEDGVRITD